MTLKKSILCILVLFVYLFSGTTAVGPQSITCTVDIISSTVTGNLVVGSPVTFTVNAVNSCGEDIYYKFFYRANYGMANYETSPWVSMTTTDYVTDNELTYSFPSAGKYIVIAWAFADPATLDANTVSLIGFSVDITAQGDTTCPVDIPHLSFSGLLVPDSPITISVTASQRCTTGTMYYKYFYRANYGTVDYNISPWISMTTTDYVTTSQIDYAFPEVGNYIVVVWAFTDPNNLDTTSVPIIGGNVAIGDISEMKVLMDLGDCTVTLPTSGDVLLKIDEENSIGSAVYYGTATAGGPDLPLSKLTLRTSDGQSETLFDSRGRPTTITEGTMRIVITYNADGSFNYEVQENGTVVYTKTNRAFLNELTRHTSGVLLDDAHVPPKKVPTTDLSPAAFRATDWELAMTKLAKDALTGEAQKGRNFKVGKNNPNDYPFLRALFENAVIMKTATQMATIATHSIRSKDPKEVCRNATVPADCERKVREGYAGIQNVVKLLVAIVEGMVAEEWEYYKNLPLRLPVTYKGSAVINVTGCGTCAGVDDNVEIELKADGTLTAKWYFWVTGGSPNCTVTMEQRRTKTGTHNFKGWFFIPDHLITGTWTNIALNGSGTKPGMCQVSMTISAAASGGN